MLAFWLALSPFIFAHELFVHDFTIAFLIALFSLLSFHERLEKMHLCNLMIAAWLIGSAFSASIPLPSGLQNHLIIGILLTLFGIVPSHSHLPPKAWRQFYLRAKKQSK